MRMILVEEYKRDRSALDVSTACFVANSMVRAEIGQAEFVMFKVIYKVLPVCSAECYEANPAVPLDCHWM